MRAYLPSLRRLGCMCHWRNSNSDTIVYRGVDARPYIYAFSDSFSYPDASIPYSFSSTTLTQIPRATPASARNS